MRNCILFTRRRSPVRNTEESDKLCKVCYNELELRNDRGEIAPLLIRGVIMAGKVILVGAGPGDAGLLTVKGLRELQRADVVVHDRLVDDGIMQLIPANAERIDVGKRVADHPVPQHEINRILLRKAQEGKRVVRLKGGDCFVFGRGGEELELLSDEGVDFEVVPGITSALAAAAYAGVPATHRDYCASVHIITGHRRRNEALDMDFDALVRLNGTLVFLMAVATFGDIARGLMAAGMPPEYPCAIVENGTRPEQRKLLTTVGGAEACIAENGVKTPAIFVVGRVCELSERMDWFDRLPLKGKRVLVAKPKADSHRLTDLLRERGARVTELSAPSVQHLEFEMPGAQTNLLLSDAESANALFVQLEKENKDVRALAAYRLVCESKGAEQVLRGRGMYPDAVCGEWPEVRLVREGEDGLPVWRLILPEPMRWLPDGDCVAFTTLSGVEAFGALAQSCDVSGLTAVCIGAMTADAARKLGMKVVVAAEKTLESVADCIADI